MIQTTKKSLSDLMNELNIPYSGGRRVRCPCPIHGGNDNNFVINFSNKISWQCYSHQCELEFGGNLVGLVRSIKNCSIKEALCIIDSVNLVDYHTTSLTTKQEPKENVILSKDTINFKYSSPYFLNRGFNKSTIKFFKIFECNDKQHSLYGRAIVPLFDHKDQLMGLTGRSIHENSSIKWMHYPKNLIKSKILYNMNFAKKYIWTTDTVCIVEGPADVWRLFECGIYNVVATLGTSISRYQINLLIESGAKKAIILNDPDDAGMFSTLSPKGMTGKLNNWFKIYSLRHLLKDDIGDQSVDFIKRNIVPEIYKIVREKL